MGRGVVRTASPFLLLLAVVPLAGQSASVAEQSLRPGDGVYLQVRDEPELAGEYPVAEDGRVLLPLIGFVSVAARPFDVVRAEVRERYGRELVDPEIQVSPRIRIAVLGEVRQPGLFPVDPMLTVAEIIATAGGLTPSANRDRIEVLREGEVVVAEVVPESRVSEIRVRSGDQIVVGRQGWLRENLPIVLSAGASIVVAAVTSLILR